MITSAKNEKKGGLPLSGKIRSVQFRSGQVMSVISGQNTSVRSGEFRFGHVVLRVPGRQSRSAQFRSSQVGPFRSAG